MSIQKTMHTASKVSSLFIFLCVVCALSAPQTLRAQGLELNGGWSHATANFGTDGFEIGGAWWFTKRVTLAGNYDSTWDTSNLTSFAFTEVGPIAVHSHLQTVLFGPRVFFSTDWTTKHKLNPFGEAQFGVSDLSQKVSQVTGSVSNSDSGFAWMLGGGAEYLLNPHWSARANLDFLRTHQQNEGQSHLRLVIGLTYTFGARE